MFIYFYSCTFIFAYVTPQLYVDQEHYTDAVQDVKLANDISENCHVAYLESKL